MTAASYGRPRDVIRTARLVWLVLIVVLGWLARGSVGAQQDPIVQLLASTNGARIANGLAPYALDATLSVSAQLHSDDMAANDYIGHTGSDGSASRDRIVAAGYPAYSGGILGTEVVYGGVGGPTEPFDWWMTSPVHRELILSTSYREMGIGMAARLENGRTYWTLNFGARPNVLPIFVNHGASQTESRQVIVTLSNEGGMVYGDGPGVIGLATEVRMTSNGDLSGATWQPWRAQIQWVLPAGDGPKTITVEFRDQAGRTTTSQASILLSGSSAVPVATDTPTAEPTPAPTAAPPTPVPSPTRTSVPPTLAPSATPTAEPPTDTPTVTPTETRPSPSPSPSPTHPPPTIIEPTSPHPEAVPVSQRSAQPVPFTRWLAVAPQAAVPYACGLQAVATLLGFVVAARRRRPPKGGDQG